MSAFAGGVLLIAGTGITRAAATTPPSQGTITLDGTAQVVAFSKVGQATQLTFPGTTGQGVSIVISKSSVKPDCPAVLVSLQRPDNSQLGSPTSVCGAGGFVDTQTLDVNGTWSILLTPQGNDKGRLTIQAYSVTDQMGTIVRNAIAVPVSVTTPGQNARFTFSSVAGQQISSILSASTFATTCGAVQLSLVRPDGSAFGTVASSCKKTAFLDGQTLDASGTWTLLVDPQGPKTGTANLTAYNTDDVGGLTKSDGSVFAIAAMNPGQNATVHFSGTTGQEISALVTNAAYPGCPGYLLSLQRPDGSAFGTVANGCTKTTFLDAQTLDQNGVWSVVVDPQGPTVGTSRLQVWDATDATKPITLNGAPINAVLDPGQNGSYSFSGVVGQQVSATVSSSTISGCPGYVLEYVRPNGSVAGSTNGCGANAFLDSLTLDQNGTWTLEIDPVGSASGSATVNGYTFADDDGPADLTGKPAFLNFNRPGQNAQWSFTGSSGQKISAYVTDADLTDCDYTLSLVRPNGSVLGAPVDSCSATAFLDAQVLDQNGTWTVVVDPKGTNVGSATLEVFAVVDQSLKFKPGPDLKTFTSQVPGTNASYLIAAKNGDVRTVSITGSTYDAGACPDVVVSLLRPDGSVFTSASTCGSTITISSATLDMAGTWTLFVDPQGPATGTMVIRLT